MESKQRFVIDIVNIISCVAAPSQPLPLIIVRVLVHRLVFLKETNNYHDCTKQANKTNNVK